LGRFFTKAFSAQYKSFKPSTKNSRKFSAASFFGFTFWVVVALPFYLSFN
jgi:hypothetical protein